MALARCGVTQKQQVPPRQRRPQRRKRQRCLGAHPPEMPLYRGDLTHRSVMLFGLIFAANSAIYDSVTGAGDCFH